MILRVAFSFKHSIRVEEKLNEYEKRVAWYPY